MADKFKVGDRVMVTESDSYFTAGIPGTVTRVDGDGCPAVQQDSGYSSTNELSTGEKGTFISEHKLTLVEPPKKEETKALQVGDTVEVVDDYNRTYNKGDRAVVTFVRPSRLYVGIRLLTGAEKGTTYSGQKIERFKKVTNVKKQAAEIDASEVQVGDTIVAFWDEHGVEYRQKGTVTEIDDGNLIAGDHGNYINKRDLWTPAEHIYLVDRPKPEPKPEPEPVNEFETAGVGSVAHWELSGSKWIKVESNKWAAIKPNGFSSYSYDDGAMKRDKNIEILHAL